MAALGHSKGLLNDVCINGSAALLQHFFSSMADYSVAATQCAIFSTHDMSRVQYKVSDPDLWRSIKSTTYWTKDIWILPIHRPHDRHWVLAVIYLQSQEVHLFDSFVGQRQWQIDIEVQF